MEPVALCLAWMPPLLRATDSAGSLVVGTRHAELLLLSLSREGGRAPAPLQRPHLPPSVAGEPHAVAPHPRALRYATVCGSDPTLRLWALPDKCGGGACLLALQQLAAPCAAVAFDADGARLAAVAARAPRLYLFDAATLDQTADATYGKGPAATTTSAAAAADGGTCVRFSPNGRLLAVGSLSGALHLFAALAAEMTP